MNIKLKTLSLAVALTLSTSALALDEITIWEGENKESSIYKAANDFGKEFNCKVNIKTYDEANQLNKVEELLDKGAKDEVPDIFIMISDRLGQALSKDVIAKNRTMSSDKNLYIKSSVDAFSFDGNIYAVPRSIESLVVYYNKDILEYPFEELSAYEEFGNKIKSKGIYSLVGKYDQIFIGYGFLSAYGGYIFGQDRFGNYNVKDVGVNKNGAASGLKELVDLAKTMPKELYTPEGWGLVDEYFKTGKAAAVINGPWALQGYANSGINYGVAPLPKLSNGKYIHPFYGIKGYVISNQSKQKDLAEKFLQYLNQSRYVLIRYNTTAEVPPILSVLENPLIVNDDFASAVSSQVENADPMPYAPEMQYVWDPTSKAISESILDNKDPKQALDEAEDSILSSY